MASGGKMLPFDEKYPWGKPAPGTTIVAIGGDNIEFSRYRRDAIVAMRSGRATPEQAALVRETDEIYSQAINGTSEEE